MKKSEEKYSTSDLNLAAALTTVGFEVSEIDSPIPRKSVFYFKNSAKLEKAISEYYTKKMLVDPIELCSNIRMLKSRIQTQE